MAARSRLSGQSPEAASTLLGQLVALPLQTASLSLSLSTLPLTLALYMVGLGECPALVDRVLSWAGLQRTGRARDELQASEAAAQRQLRQATARLKVATEQLERSETARHIAERALQEALDRQDCLRPVFAHSLQSTG